MVNNIFFKISVAVIVVIGLFFAFKTEDKKVEKVEIVKIGFVGALTGKYSVLGNAMINGIYLALEEINYKVNNKKIEFIIRDDKQDGELNKKLVNEFIKNDIKIVIGNVTSTMSKISMSIINKHDDMFMISASSASDTFTGIDDRFFRVHVANNVKRFDGFTKKLLKDGYNNIYGIYDPGNPAYTKDFLINFEKSLIKNGGKELLVYEKTNTKLDKLVNDINKLKPDLIMICANTVDTAKVVQYLRLKKITTKIASSEWAMTDEFIENGGKSVEGILFNIDYDANSNIEKYVSFAKRFREKYKKEPSYFAAKAYELTHIIIDSLKKGEVTNMKEIVLETKVYEGLQDKIIFDKYGDVQRNFYNFVIKDGQYIRVND